MRKVIAENIPSENEAENVLTGEPVGGAVDDTDPNARRETEVVIEEAEKKEVKDQKRKVLIRRELLNLYNDSEKLPDVQKSIKWAMVLIDNTFKNKNSFDDNDFTKLKEQLNAEGSPIQALKNAEQKKAVFKLLSKEVKSRKQKLEASEKPEKLKSEGYEDLVAEEDVEKARAGKKVERVEDMSDEEIDKMVEEARGPQETEAEADEETPQEDEAGVDAKSWLDKVPGYTWSKEKIAQANEWLDEHPKTRAALEAGVLVGAGGAVGALGGPFGAVFLGGATYGVKKLGDWAVQQYGEENLWSATKRVVKEGWQTDMDQQERERDFAGKGKTFFTRMRRRLGFISDQERIEEMEDYAERKKRKS